MGRKFQGQTRKKLSGKIVGEHIASKIVWGKRIFSISIYAVGLSTSVRWIFGIYPSYGVDCPLPVYNPMGTSFPHAHVNNNYDTRSRPKSPSVKFFEKNKSASFNTSIAVNFSSSDILDELTYLTGGSYTDKIECPVPLIPFYDKVIRNTNEMHLNTTHPQRIPRILHVAFKSRCLSKDIMAHMDRWKLILPNYSIFLHDDDAVGRLIYGNDWTEFPNIHKIMRCVRPGVMTIDVWRVLLLYKYGGFYTDIDNWPFDAFTEDLIEPDVSAFFFGDTKPAQRFISSEAHHPIMYLAMRNIQKNIINIRELSNINILKTTGLRAFKSGYAAFLAKQKDIFGGGIHTGMLDMKVQKMASLEGTDQYIRSEYKFNEIVPFNETLNVTKGERIELETGIKLWHKDHKDHKSWHKDHKLWHKDRRKQKGRQQGSCKDHIARLDQELGDSRNENMIV